MNIAEIIIRILCGIGTLLIGFEILSTNVTKLFRKGLKQLFNKTSKNDLVGVGIGTATTAIMQSSAATTVMVVGFVNAGLMSLHQATTIIMGANIGTTITAQLAALSAFNFAAFAIGCVGIGVVINMFAKKEKTKTIAYALEGFGLLFLGLTLISEAVKQPVIKESIGNLLSSINGWYAPALLFVLGIVLTALVQSSALITTIIITLTGAGIYIGSGGEQYLTNNVLYLIIGTNIGTCITALISGVTGNTNAKRASIIHLLFNLAGGILFIIIFIIFPHFMENTFGKLFDQPATQIAMFHTFFNLLCTICFLPITNLFVKLAEKIIPEKDEKAQMLQYLDDRMLKSPSIAISMVRKELTEMYIISYNTLNVALDGFFERDVDVKDKVFANIDKLNKMSKLVIDFMVKLSDQDLAQVDEIAIGEYQKTLHDIIRIAEIGDNVCKYTRKMVDEDLDFSENVNVQLGLYRQQVKKLFDLTETVYANKNLDKLSETLEVEESIDNMRKVLVDDHFDRLNKGLCKPQNSGVFVNLVNNIERAADHMTFIAQSVQEEYEQRNH